MIDSGTDNIWCVNNVGNDYLEGASYTGPDPGQGTCAPPDSDGDGVPDDEDQCGGTVLPEIVPLKKLLPNHYADVDGDAIFETTEPKGKDKAIVDSDYTLVDTYGCSCEQILDIKPGKNRGEMKSGCTKGTLDVWSGQTGWAKK